MMFVFPNSYANVEWQCSWACSVEYMKDYATTEVNSGMIHAEAGFKYFLSESLVELWAYVRCYTEGSATGNGGKTIKTSSHHLFSFFRGDKMKEKYSTAIKIALIIIIIMLISFFIAILLTQTAGVIGD